MMKVMLRNFAYTIILVIGLLGCAYETLEPDKVVVPDKVSFNANVIPIFNKSCSISGCHVKSGIPPDLSTENAFISLTFFGYVDTDTPTSSEIYEVITNGTMKKFATDQDRAIIIKWIEQGAEND